MFTEEGNDILRGLTIALEEVRKKSGELYDMSRECEKMSNKLSTMDWELGRLITILSQTIVLYAVESNQNKGDNK